MTKLTKAEYRLLDALNSVEGGRLRYVDLRGPKVVEVHGMLSRCLLSKHEFAKGYVVATAAGRRSYSRGVR